MVLGRGSKDVVYKKMGKAKYSSEMHKESKHKTPNGMMMDEEMKMRKKMKKM